MVGLSFNREDFESPVPDGFQEDLLALDSALVRKRDLSIARKPGPLVLQGNGQIDGNRYATSPHRLPDQPDGLVSLRRLQIGYGPETTPIALYEGADVAVFGIRIKDRRDEGALRRRSSHFNELGVVQPVAADNRQVHVQRTKILHEEAGPECLIHESDAVMFLAERRPDNGPEIPDGAVIRPAGDDGQSGTLARRYKRVGGDVAVVVPYVEDPQPRHLVMGGAVSQSSGKLSIVRECSEEQLVAELTKPGLRDIGGQEKHSRILVNDRRLGGPGRIEVADGGDGLGLPGDPLGYLESV
jgi:hypothetical protein